MLVRLMVQKNNTFSFMPRGKMNTNDVRRNRLRAPKHLLKRTRQVVGRAQTIELYGADSVVEGNFTTIRF